MKPTECSKTNCTAPAEFIVKIHARTRPTDDPIELVLGLAVCKDHPPPLEFLDGSIWDILDTWALNGRHRLCDRELTQIILIPMRGEEGLILQSMLKPNG
jgi:hypothetical protein